MKFFSIIFTLTLCTLVLASEPFNFKLKTLENGKKEINKYFIDYNVVAFVFLSPECPLSQNYTKQIREINELFKSQNAIIIPVFSGKLFKESEILDFKRKYSIQVECLLDKKYKLARITSASVTPEVFMYNSNDHELIYSGAIDNWAISLGKQRKEITETYLVDAIDATLNGRKPELNRTKPIGCFLEVP